MRNGFKVYDADTHVMPIAEVLEQYVGSNLKPETRQKLLWDNVARFYKQT